VSANSASVQARIVSGDYGRLAMANPELAPYGRAAKQTLLELGLWDDASSRVVTGENVAQAYQFTASGNADLGFVAVAQLERSAAPQGSWWLVPASHHDPIEQQVVQLTDHAAAGRFFDFARSAEALEIIRRHGYALPDDL
jgi:molybdate transport system substrate-binding protein